MKAFSKQTAFVFSGKMVGAALGFAMSLIVARWMGPAEFGLFSLFIMVLILGNDFLGDGLNPGVVRYYAMYRESDSGKAAKVLTNALVLRLLLGVPLVLIGVPAAIELTRTVLPGTGNDSPIVLGLIGSLGAALWTFHLSAWQAREEFHWYAVMVTLVNLLRVLSIPVLLFFTGQLTLTAIMAVHVAIYFICAGAGFRLLCRHFAPFQIDGALLRELFRFSRWPAIASLCFLLQVNLGVPVLNYTANAREAGLYAAGSALLMAIDFLTVSLLTTLLPRVSRLTDLSQCRSYVRRSLPIYLGIAAALAPLLFLARPIVLTLFGPAYEETIVVFQVLFCGVLATLVTHPLYLVFYTMNRPELYTFSGVTALVGWITVGYWLIPAYGAIGAAWTTLFGRLVQSMIILILLWMALDSRPSAVFAGRSMMTDSEAS
ncbi:MAG: oligosaccharide flippase family protein [Nitrospiraceae bacterium]